MALITKTGFRCHCGEGGAPAQQLGGNGKPLANEKRVWRQPECPFALSYERIARQSCYALHVLERDGFGKMGVKMSKKRGPDRWRIPSRYRALIHSMRGAIADRCHAISFVALRSENAKRVHLWLYGDDDLRASPKEWLIFHLVMSQNHDRNHELSADRLAFRG
jgi:hypothetical protein